MPSHNDSKDKERAGHQELMRGGSRGAVIVMNGTSIGSPGRRWLPGLIRRCLGVAESGRNFHLSGVR